LATSASVETLSDEAVQKQSKEFLEHMLDDENIKKKTAAAVWGVIGNMLLPAFLFKSGPGASNSNAEPPPPLSATPEGASTASAVTKQGGAPWYYFSGVLGWVLPSFRKSEIDIPAPKQDDTNDTTVPAPSPASPIHVPPPSASADSALLPMIPGSAPAAGFQQSGIVLPADVVPIIRENSSGNNITREFRSTQAAQIPTAPPHVALLVPPSSGEEGDNSFTDDDRRGTGSGERRS